MSSCQRASAKGLTLDSVVASRTSRLVAAAELLGRQETEDTHSIGVTARNAVAGVMAR